MIFVFICYLFVVTALCYVIFLCYEQIRYTKKLLDNAIKERESQWFYTKTQLGRIQLEATKKRAASKEYILFIKTFSAIIIIAFTIILFYLIIDIFRNGIPTSPFGNPYK